MCESGNVLLFFLLYVSWQFRNELTMYDANAPSLLKITYHLDIVNNILT